MSVRNRSAAEIEQDYHRTMDQHRKQKQQNRKAYAASLTAEPVIDGMRPHVLFVWRRGVWLLLAFVKDRPSPARWRHWRKRYKVQAREVVRALSLFYCQRHGPPTEEPKAAPDPRKQPRRVAPLNTAASITIVDRTTRAKSGAPKCWHAQRKPQCKKKSLWLVGYRNSKTNRRYVLNGCTTHAWDDTMLPKHATQVVRVDRTILDSPTLS